MNQDIIDGMMELADATVENKKPRMLKAHRALIKAYEKDGMTATAATAAANDVYGTVTSNMVTAVYSTMQEFDISNMLNPGGLHPTVEKDLKRDLDKHRKNGKGAIESLRHAVIRTGGADYGRARVLTAKVEDRLAGLGRAPGPEGDSGRDQARPGPWRGNGKGPTDSIPF